MEILKKHIRVLSASMADEGKDQASQSPAKARPIKERFDNAVKVIRSLPKEGKIWSISTRPLIISRGYSLHARVALVSRASPSYAKERERVWSKGSRLRVPEECNQDVR